MGADYVGGTALLHHHAPYRLSPERKRRLTWLIRLDHELLVLAHHLEEPVVGFTSTVDAVGGCESERHLRGWAASVGILAADRQARSVGHASKAMADDRAVRWLDGRRAIERLRQR